MNGPLCIQDMSTEYHEKVGCLLLPPYRSLPFLYRSVAAGEGEMSQRERNQTQHLEMPS